MISNLYPGAQVEKPMLISKQPPLSTFYNKLETGDYLAQVKKDGYFYQLHKTKEGEVYLFSRSLSKVTGFFSEKIENVPHIKKWATNYLPNDTVLIGEIYYPGKKSNDVTKIMGALPATAVERQFKTDVYGGPIRFYVHDIIRYQGKDLISDTPFEERYYHYLEYNLCDIFPPHYCMGNLICEDDPAEVCVELAEIYDNNLSDTLDKIFQNGEEGMVFKYKNGLYVPGKRPTYNFKAKTETTFDAVIIDFIDPEKLYTGKEIENWNYWIAGNPVTKAYYNGWKAGIIVGAFDSNGKMISIGNISSGMTDFLREDMAKNPNKYLGQVVEIQAMSVNSDDLTIRHGRLVKLRPDKTASECTLDTIF